MRRWKIALALTAVFALPAQAQVAVKAGGQAIGKSGSWTVYSWPDLGPKFCLIEMVLPDGTFVTIANSGDGSIDNSIWIGNPRWTIAEGDNVVRAFSHQSSAYERKISDVVRDGDLAAYRTSQSYLDLQAFTRENARLILKKDSKTLAEVPLPSAETLRKTQYCNL